jgi:hypothetical protein
MKNLEELKKLVWNTRMPPEDPDIPDGGEGGGEEDPG